MNTYSNPVIMAEKDNGAAIMAETFKRPSALEYVVICGLCDLLLNFYCLVKRINYQNIFTTCNCLPGVIIDKLSVFWEVIKTCASYARMC